MFMYMFMKYLVKRIPPYSNIVYTDTYSDQIFYFSITSDITGKLFILIIYNSQQMANFDK